MKPPGWTAVTPRIVTADVAGTPVGEGRRSALLTPKGHVLADMWLFVREEAIWVVVDPGQAEPTAASLSRYAIMDDFAAGREPEFASFSVLGPEAGAALSASGLPGALALVARPPLAHLDARTEAGDVWIVRVRELGSDGFWVGGRRPVVASRLRALEDAGVPQAGLRRKMKRPKSPANCSTSCARSRRSRRRPRRRRLRSRRRPRPRPRASRRCGRRSSGSATRRA